MVLLGVSEGMTIISVSGGAIVSEVERGESGGEGEIEHFLSGGSGETR